MRQIAMLGTILLALSMVFGCADKAIYRQAAESGWENWEKDHKPVVSDEEFSARSEEDQALHMSTTKKAAREFEREQALSLLTD